MSGRAAASTLAGLALVCASRSASAADVGVVASTREGEPFASRLVLELEQLGMTVAREEKVAITSGETVLVVVAPNELGLYEPAPDGTLAYHPLSSPRSDALKAAEEVRARLLPLVARPAPPVPPPVAPAPPPPAADVVPPPARSPAARTSFELALGAAVMLGAASPGAAVSASAAAYPRPLRLGAVAFGVGVGGTLQVGAGTLEAREGAADTRALAFGPELVARAPLGSHAAASVALGAWATHLRVGGRATAPFTSREDEAWAISPTARLRVEAVLGAVSAFVEGRVAAAVPPVAIRFAGTTVDEWGSPWATAGGGAAVAF